MEFISGQLVNKKYWKSDVCFKIDNFQMKEKLYGSYLHINVLPAVFLRRVFDDLFKDIVVKRAADLLEYSRFYSADLTNIGCGVGVYQNVSMILKCITSVDDSMSFTETYLPGSPCSNCSISNQVCSRKYPGLCEDCLKGEKCSFGEMVLAGARSADGLIGEKGEKGADGLNGQKCQSNIGISEKVEVYLIALYSSLIILFLLILIILLIILFMIFKHKSTSTT